jgi:hypothetical protein
MVAGQRGCTFPCCDKPAMLSQAHHAVQDWADGGLTDIDSLAFACGPHNRIVGNDPGQWRTYVVKDGPDAGKIAWVPPEYVDPERKPRINRVHHPDEALHRARDEILAERLAALDEREQELRAADTSSAGTEAERAAADPDPPADE